MIARLWFPVAMLALSACPPMKPAAVASVKAGDLPTAVTDLNRYIDEQWKTQTPASMENSLLAADKALAADKNYDSEWRAARACAWLTDDGRNYVQRGIDYAHAAVSLEPKRVEGEYYLGINVGQLAQQKSKKSLVPEVEAAAKLAVQLDEKFDNAGPLRLLGLLYAEAPPPPTSVGDLDEGLKLLKRAVEIVPGYPLNHLQFCRALVKKHAFPDAERECQVVQHAAAQPQWAVLLPRWQKDAEKWLQQIQRLRHDSNNGGLP